MEVSYWNLSKILVLQTALRSKYRLSTKSLDNFKRLLKLQLKQETAETFKENQVSNKVFIQVKRKFLCAPFIARRTSKRYSISVHVLLSMPSSTVSTAVDLFFKIIHVLYFGEQKRLCGLCWATRKWIADAFKVLRIWKNTSPSKPQFV